MRQTALQLVYELAKADRRVLFVGSDLGVGTLEQFKREMPDRFFMEGVSEASIVGMAAGLAMEGRVVYINTIATFLTRRCFEQIVLDLCLHNANVRLIGSGGGVVYAPLGSTHLAFDDLAILRSIPRMTVVAPCDAEEMKRLMPQTLDWPGPIYIRLGKGGDPIVSSAAVPFVLGKAILAKPGKDALIVTTGITLKTGLDAAAELGRQGLAVAVLHMHTVKPLDTAMLLDSAAPVSVVVTVEEHTVIGGLGGAVAEAFAEANFRTPKRFKRIGIPDVFPDEFGSQASLMARHGVNTETVVSTVRTLFES